MCGKTCSACWAARQESKPLKWSPRVTHTKLSDGRVVERGSREEAEFKWPDLVESDA